MMRFITTTPATEDPHIVLRRSCFMSNYFICQAPKLWSNLPNDLKQATSSKSFKNQIKRFNMIYPGWGYSLGTGHYPQVL